MPPGVLVTADSDDPVVRDRATALAEELGLPMRSDAAPVFEGPDLWLVVTEDRLELRETGPDAAGPVYVDFVHGPSGYRRRSNLSRRQPLALALGLGRGPVTVVDATAGLARDAFLLASLGCPVIAVERSVVLGALIRDGLRRANEHGSQALRNVLGRLTLIVDDARAVLDQMMRTTPPDVVYIDPMYPPRKKSALSKKEMRILRRLVGDDPDVLELFTVARDVALRRVVVKRPRHAPSLAPAPAVQCRGKQVRYDVYRPVRAQPA